MSAAGDLLRTRATIVWFGLIAATLISWRLGTEHGGGDHQTASTVILVVALAKVRFVGLYFMDLRTAPAALRGMFEAYCAVVLLATAGVYLLA
ncbi:hypothetical protein DSM112329_00348 [Paraconexibacter sp. AEG42_29]|uniref:Prokaryotic cytochrome C oxidase subunit IV family protein n=1 Tax=Paraconexibacter sp. AEG42_29 TaxID=2997339 RepID=A0AAU7APK1_9ACTN